MTNHFLKKIGGTSQAEPSHFRSKIPGKKLLYNCIFKKRSNFAMVAIAYYISRGIGLTLSLLLTLASLSQLCYYLYLIKHHKKIELKCYIHLGCLFNSFCIMICFIDGYGLFNYFPFGVSRILTNTIAIRGIAIGLCFIIYGHFSAHYLAAKKIIPRFFERALFLSFIISTVPSLIGSILSEWNPLLYRIEVAFQTAWTLSIAIIDAYGYYLVRELIMDLKKSQLPPSSNGVPSRNNHDSHHTTESGSGSTSVEDLLIRIRRYHIIFLIMMIGYVLYGTYALITQSKGNFVRPNFDKFSMGVSTSWMPFTFLILQIILTWWAWTPFTTMQEIFLSHSGSKAASSTEIHRKMTSSAPTPSNKDKSEHISSTELIRSPSEEQNLLKTSTEQNIDHSVKEETVYYEQPQSPVVGSEDLSASGPVGEVEDMSISGRPLNDEVVHVAIGENGQIVLPQKL